MIAFFLIGWAFYLLISALIIVNLIFLEKDKLGWSHFILIALFYLVAIKFDLNWQWAKDNFLTILIYIGYYLGVGVIWAFIKWFFYLKDIASQYQTLKEVAGIEFNNFMSYKSQTNDNSEELKNKNKNSSSYDSSKTLKDFIYDKWKNNYDIRKKGLEIICTGTLRGVQEYRIEIPTANKNKARIVTWISHWPISLLWTMINDPIKKLLNKIFNVFKGMFQHISNMIFKETLQDFK